jgi:hypothetical protein
MTPSQNTFLKPQKKTLIKNFKKNPKKLSKIPQKTLIKSLKNYQKIPQKTINSKNNSKSKKMFKKPVENLLDSAT